jgi:peroxiredoxin
MVARCTPEEIACKRSSGPTSESRLPSSSSKAGRQAISLSEYLGRKNVVLVFFPLAFSPVCSHQLPSIEKEMSRFRDLNAEVLGISVDSHFANEAFAERLRLSFPLCPTSDTPQARRTACSTRTRSIRARRFVVDKQGRIAYKDVSADVRQVPSNEGILEALARLTG